MPVYAECISPDTFSEKSLEEISALTLWMGNKQRTLGELFNIKREDDNDTESITIRIFGDLSKVRRIGAKMTDGKIFIEDDVGMHLGEMMKGGEITVKGNADSWAGCMMEGGRIEIFGSAGDYVGAPYRGSTQGMKNGTIIIHGNAGNDLGCHMRSGFIEVEGNVGEFAGVNMKDGTILIQEDCKGRAGAFMLNGRIIICGYIPSVLPTFTIDGIRQDIKIDGERIAGPFYRFIGDITEGGEGKLFIKKERNPHLESYEKYL